jgi:hypothetical protein
VVKGYNHYQFGTTKQGNILPKDVWDKCVPKDNIHPAHGTNSFSSLGCLTVRGKFGSAGSTDQWKKMQEVAGASNDGVRFDVLLLTGLDFAARSAMRKAGSNEDDIDKALRCLRHGSEGDEVKKLQTALGFGSGANGAFGPATKQRLGDHQKSQLGWGTGIYSTDMDEYLGFTVWN